MKLFVLCFSVILSVSTNAALTDSDFIQINYQDEIDSRISHEMTVAEARDENHLNELLSYFSKKLSKEEHVKYLDAFYNENDLKKYNLPKNQAKNSLEKLWRNYFPEVNSEKFELGEKSLKDLYAREPSSFNPFAKIEKGRLKSFPQKTFRVVLTFVRTTVAGGASGFVFFKTGLPLIPSIIMGTVIGGISGSIQWWIEPFVEYLETNKTTGKVKNWLVSKLPFLEKLGIKKVEKLGKKSNRFSFYTKWLFTEVAFVSIIEGILATMGSAGMIEYNKLFWGVSHEIMTSSFMTLGTQGIWEESVVKEYGPKIERIEKMIAHAKKYNQLNRLAHLERLHQKMIVKKSAMFVYGSATQISALILKTMGFKIHYFVFGGLGVSGVINLVRISMKEKQSWLRKQFRKIPWACRIFSR